MYVWWWQNIKWWWWWWWWSEFRYIFSSHFSRFFIVISQYAYVVRVLLWKNGNTNYLCVCVVCACAYVPLPRNPIPRCPYQLWNINSTIYWTDWPPLLIIWLAVCMCVFVLHAFLTTFFYITQPYINNYRAIRTRRHAKNFWLYKSLKWVILSTIDWFLFVYKIHTHTHARHKMSNQWSHTYTHTLWLWLFQYINEQTLPVAMAIFSIKKTDMAEYYYQIPRTKKKTNVYGQ